MHAMLRRPAVALVLLTLAAPLALASGFHVFEQGAKASGQAALVWLEQPAVAAGFSGVYIGDTQFTSAVNQQRYDMFDHTPTPVHLFYGQRIKDTPFAFGFGVTTPFGLITDWSDPAFIAKYVAYRTDLRTIVFNLNGAMQIGDNFAFALGVDYMTADLRDFSRWINAPVDVPVPLDLDGDETADLVRTAYTATDIFSNLTGDGSEFGWNAALHFKGEQWSAGLSYRSGFDVTVEGAAGFTRQGTTFDMTEFEELGLPAEVIDGIVAQVGPLVAAGVDAAFPSGPGSGVIKIPATLAAGVAFTGLEKWEFELDIHRVEWSSFDNIPLDFQNNTDVLVDQAVLEDWEDTTSFRFGAAWDIAPAHQIRAGIYTEDSAIPLRTLRPSIPDADRMGYSAGYGFQGKNFGIDLYVMYVTLDSVTVGAADVDLDNPAEVLRQGTYESTLQLLGATATYRF
jgi:long-chain fatty acid transport protein